MGKVVNIGTSTVTVIGIDPIPYWRARAATGTEIARSLSTSRVLRDMNEPSVLPASLRGHLPASIRKTIRRSSLDIPEHRAIKSCLRHWGQWLTDAADLLANAPPESRKGGASARMRGCRTHPDLPAGPAIVRWRRRRSPSARGEPDISPRTSLP